MTVNLLADVRSNTLGTCPTSWAAVPDCSVTGQTVQGTDSVVILTGTVTIDGGSDESAEFRFLVNGSATGSPIQVTFSDAGTRGEVHGMTIVWAVDGLSGSSNTFALEWQRLQNIANTEVLVFHSFQVIEIVGGDASIIVDQTASDQVAVPATETPVLEQTGVTVDGTGSILLFLGTVPMNNSTDYGTLFRFGVDGTPEGARTYAGGDGGTVGDQWSWCGIHVKTGVSAGSHSFQVEWQDGVGVSGASEGGRLRSFQVVEITAGCEILSAQPAVTSSWTISSGFGNDPTLDVDEVIAGTDSFVMVIANAQVAVATADQSVDFSLGIDDSEVGGTSTNFNDDADQAGSICLIHVETGLSAASHSFQLRGALIQGTKNIDNSQNRSMFVLEFTEGGTPQTVVMDELTLAGSAPNIAVAPGGTSHLMDELTLAGSAPSLTVTVGGVAVVMDELTLAGSAPILTLVSGPITVALNEVTLVGSAPSLTLVSVVSIPMDELTLASSIPSITIGIGGVVVAANSISLVGSAPAVTVVGGPISVGLNELTLAGTAPNIVVVNVAPRVQVSWAQIQVPTSTGITIAMSELTLVGSAPTLSVVPGAISVIMNELTLASSAPNLTVVAVVSIPMNELTLAGTAPSLTVVPGAISVALNEVTLAGSAEALTVVSGATVIVTNELTLAGSTEALTVVAVVSVVMDELTLAGAAEALTVVAGAISIPLNELTLAGSTPALVVVPGAVTVTANSITLAGSAPNLTVTVGERIALDELTLAGSAPALTVVGGPTSVALNELTLVGSAPTITVLSESTVVMGEITLASTAPSILIGQGVQLNELTLAGSSPSLTVAVGGVVAFMNELVLISSAPTLAAIPGNVPVAMSELTLAGTAPSLAIDAQVSVALNELTLAGSTEALTIGVGGVTVALQSLVLSAVATDIFIHKIGTDVVFVFLARTISFISLKARTATRDSMLARTVTHVGTTARTAVMSMKSRSAVFVKMEK